MFKRVVIHFRVILHFMVILMPFIVILQHFKFPYLSFLDNLGNLLWTGSKSKEPIVLFKYAFPSIYTKNPAARKELPGEMPETQVAIDVSKEPIRDLNCNISLNSQTLSLAATCDQISAKQLISGIFEHV
eukprot:GHVP01023852.1.p1 GENE.GHVP01023852.1~~GHVP01023852.1.p1  ORF type:complete len:130 (-),score=2.99 GHVP01023852.1:15-404(-)